MYEDDGISRFQLLYDDADLKIVMEVAPSFMRGVFIHSEVKSFSKSKYGKAKYVWSRLVEYLHSHDIHNIYALPTDSIAEKWETKFGFVDTGVTFEGQKIMKYLGE